jgi:GTPase SAR1 family protein
MTTKDRLKANNDLFIRVAPYLSDGATLNEISFLQERLASYNSYVVLLGETSSGKSTLLNGLLKDPCLPTGRSHTTGSIVEIIFDGEGDQYFIIQALGGTRKLTRSEFQQMCRSGHARGERLQLFTDKNRFDFCSAHFFDTPGFGSIIDNHDIVTNEFIPQCDIVIYVIDFRTAVSPDDADHLRYIKSLMDTSLEFILVINCAFGDDSQSKGRIEEIKEHVNDIMQQSVATFVIPSCNRSDPGSDNGNILPSAPELWNDVKRVLLTPDRVERFEFGKLLLQESLLEEVSLELSGVLVSGGDKDSLRESSNKVLCRRKEVVGLIEKRYSSLAARMPKLLGAYSIEAEKAIFAEVEQSGRWTQKTETVAFVNSYLFWKHSMLCASHLARYIQDEIEDLNRQIEGLLNTTMDEYRKDIGKIDFGDVEAVKSHVQKQGTRMLASGMESFFLKYAGSGGLKSGIPNAAKAGLRRAGEMFNTTFSREAHNGLAIFLKRIGANSSRAVGIAAAIFVEGILYALDVASWKAFLRKRIGKSMMAWKDKMEESVTKDLREMKDHNIGVLGRMFKAFKPTSQGPRAAANLNTVRKLSAEIDAAIEANRIIIKEHYHGTD